MYLVMPGAPLHCWIDSPIIATSLRPAMTATDSKTQLPTKPGRGNSQKNQSWVIIRLSQAGQHDYQLYLALNDIDHARIKVRSPQTNGICERFHKTILQEFYQFTLRKKIHTDLASLQTDLDEWLVYYNTECTHEAKICCGRTPL